MSIATASRFLNAGARAGGQRGRWPVLPRWYRSACQARSSCGVDEAGNPLRRRRRPGTPGPARPASGGVSPAVGQHRGGGQVLDPPGPGELVHIGGAAVAAATLWLTVTPAHLHAARRALREHPEIAFAAAISGPANLTASVRCRDLDHLYRFATECVGTLPEVQALEISPVLRHVKQSGAITQAGRLMDAPSQPKASQRRR